MSVSGLALDRVARPVAGFRARCPAPPPAPQRVELAMCKRKQDDPRNEGTIESNRHGVRPLPTLVDHLDQGAVEAPQHGRRKHQQDANEVGTTSYSCFVTHCAPFVPASYRSLAINRPITQ